MFCSKCGSETTEDSQFCRKCGKPLSVSSTSSGAAAAVAPAPIVAKPKSQVRTPFKIAALLIFLFVLFLIVAARSAMNKNAGTLDQLVKRQHTTTIDKPDLTVASTGYNYFKLEVPAGATSVHLDGNFTASGGTGNDIEVYVLPESDFVNWQNRHAARSYYSSGKVTVGKFSVNLPADAGTYYLVFDNRFSLFSKKEVEVKGTLNYYQ